MDFTTNLSGVHILIVVVIAGLFTYLIFVASKIMLYDSFQFHHKYLGITSYISLPCLFDS